MGGVDHVEESVFILLLFIDVSDGCGDAHHAVLVDQQEEGLRGVELQAAPDDLDQLAHVNMVWDQKLGLIQDRQLLLTLVALDDHRDLTGVLVADLLHLLTAVGEAAPLLERPVGGHRAGPAGRAAGAPGCAAQRCVCGSARRGLRGSSSRAAGLALSLAVAAAGGNSPG